MADRFLTTNYSYILDNTFDCGSVSDIKPALFDSNNRNPSNSKTLPIFRPGTNLFTTTGSLWCMNRENQSQCEPDSNYILQPTGLFPMNSTFVNNNTFNYSDNLVSSITQNNSNNTNNNIDNNLDINLNTGRKFTSTGSNVNGANNYTMIETSGNPYPFNTSFTPDGVKLSRLNSMNMEKVKCCNNRSIENRFRPVYIHVPEQFLEICEPHGYQMRNDAERINNRNIT